ncbi:hypothetical protein [Xanthomonas oryzae]|uniref:hypothetical protein n=1 Tax=Xanthomonas oryzae TaxID=347 RepID=UPI000FF8B759|nr:hypothetical protein [Xanthomonas oryzae]QGN64704.1 hypothetical protein GKO49_20610 [Xanthomonas oryzae pv. oryzae]QIE15611.1 hypothetical protein IXO1088_009915 [Xanthomonas oryzae pv. oryzae]UXV78658.1 hypothetical protein IXO842_009260 [Xanthomonas oryzae pv. oryzae]UXV86940.1 hypothetical protein IXO134_014255 [Xanthomonas oryzae pv. oryzae]UXW11356.1 hypothetical protein IXO221_013820 [Xanthomonas oryzae pv. oryzae]
MKSSPIKSEALIVTTHSATRHFRKSALSILFALATGASTSASAQAIKVYVKNYNSNVKGLWIQNEENPNGWACFPVTAPLRTSSGRITPGTANAPALLYGLYYSAYALISTDCNAGGQRINNLSTHYYKAPNNQASTTIYITNTMLNISP